MKTVKALCTKGLSYHKFIIEEFILYYTKHTERSLSEQYTQNIFTL